MFDINYMYFGRMEYNTKSRSGFVFEPCAVFKQHLNKIVFVRDFNGRPGDPVLVKFMKDTNPKDDTTGAIITKVIKYLSEEEDTDLHNGVIIGKYHYSLTHDKHLLKDLLAEQEWEVNSTTRVRYLSKARDPVMPRLSRKVEEYQFYNYLTGEWSASYYSFQYISEMKELVS